MPILKTKRLPLFLIVLASAATVGTFIFSKGLVFQKTPTSCAPPFGHFLKDRTGRVYSLNYQSKAQSDWSALFTEKVSQPGVKQDLQFTFTADWFVTSIAETDQKF